MSRYKKAMSDFDFNVHKTLDCRCKSILLLAADRGKMSVVIDGWDNDLAWALATAAADDSKVFNVLKLAHRRAVVLKRDRHETETDNTDTGEGMPDGVR